MHPIYQGQHYGKAGKSLFPRFKGIRNAEFERGCKNGGGGGSRTRDLLFRRLDSPHPIRHLVLIDYIYK